MFELIDRKTGEVAFAGRPVSRRSPCPICGKPDWCLRDHARGLTICPRVSGGRKIGEAGWLYRDHGEVPAITYTPKPTPRHEHQDFGAYVDQCIADVGEHIHRLAEKLGIPAAALEAFGCGWDRLRLLWTFPMLDADHRIIGVRTRTLGGDKYAIAGSHNGLFVPQTMHGDGPLFIEEGPTSAGALTFIGFDAIGRPSCSACVDMTIDYLLAHQPGREVVIVGNFDEPKRRPDGSTFYPGQDGAAALATAVAQACIPVRVIFPASGKDSRDWIREGATRGTVEGVIGRVGHWKRSA